MRGDWVLSDRFSGSTLAYQGYGRKLDLEVIRQLENIATAGVVPDATVLLNLPVSEGVARRNLLNNDRIEAEGMEFLERVADGFSLIAKSRNWLQIQADQSPRQVSKSIEIALKNLFDFDRG